MFNSKFFVSIFKGNFTCHVDNEAGSNEYTYEIIIYSPPMKLNGNAYNQNHTFDVIAATDFSLYCPVEGIPAPKVRTYYIAQN